MRQACLPAFGLATPGALPLISRHLRALLVPTRTVAGNPAAEDIGKCSILGIEQTPVQHNCSKGSAERTMSPNIRAALGLSTFTLPSDSAPEFN